MLDSAVKMNADPVLVFWVLFCFEQFVVLFCLGNMIRNFFQYILPLIYLKGSSIWGFWSFTHQQYFLRSSPCVSTFFCKLHYSFIVCVLSNTLERECSKALTQHKITVYFLSKLLMSKSLNVLQISGPTFNLFLDWMLIAAIIRKSFKKKIHKHKCENFIFGYVH